jgi:hypothetical protein
VIRPQASDCRFKDSVELRKVIFPQNLIPSITFSDVTGFSKMQIEWKYNPEKFVEKDDKWKAEKEAK